MLNIVLYAPEYPGNVGNIGRTCVLTNTKLHIIRPIKFDFSDKMLKKAGIDYWDKVELKIHDDLESFIDFIHGKKLYLIETGSEKSYTEIKCSDEDYYMFGREKEGLPSEFLKNNKDKIFTIPMNHKIHRSLNLSNSVAIVIYEAIRQIGSKNIL
ncbi:MAG: tRNA (cytidine(34)-2'-O)-methyltransferase [Peptoniphilaceae bacterium]|nr:tRNA (cytidine(34)-2'-O)-methyltransferase [Peptoniphilaceae bacterium]MDD7383137.1 tRNA (cytidine(34)-2'-O)-methyltransferase [Peptoniphilaceae bacterium]MDY3738132.1 tRNA (cytidine(34)-2'-O)-methyltransferase [Peptoniphilaceae bacterium]